MRHSRGLTLAETIVSAAILAVLIMLVFNLVPSSLLAVRAGEQQLEATAIAQSVLETRRAQPFRSLEVGPRVDLDPVLGSGGVTYRPALEVTVPTLSPAVPAATLQLDLLELRVTVTWDYRGRTRQVVHGAYVSRLRN